MSILEYFLCIKKICLKILEIDAKKNVSKACLGRNMWVEGEVYLSICKGGIERYAKILEYILFVKRILLLQLKVVQIKQQLKN